MRRCLAALPPPLPPLPHDKHSFALSIFRRILPQISLLPTLGPSTQQAARRLEDGEPGPSTLVQHRAGDLIPHIESLRTPLYVPYSSLVLEHCLTHSIHVYKPPCLAQSRHRKIDYRISYPYHQCH